MGIIYMYVIYGFISLLVGMEVTQGKSRLFVKFDGKILAACQVGTKTVKLK